MYDATLAETVTIGGDGVLLGEPPRLPPEAAVDGRQKIFTWFARHLSS